MDEVSDVHRIRSVRACDRGRVAGEGEFQPRADATLRLAGGDRPAVSDRDRVDDREPEAGAAGDPRARRVGAVKSFEDPVALVGWDPGAVVDHGESTGAARQRGGLQRHEPVGSGRVRERVVDQVAQRLGEAVGVRLQGAGRDRARAPAGAVGRRWSSSRDRR